MCTNMFHFVIFSQLFISLSACVYPITQVVSLRLLAQSKCVLQVSSACGADGCHVGGGEFEGVEEWQQRFVTRGETQPLSPQYDLREFVQAGDYRVEGGRSVRAG